MERKNYIIAVDLGSSNVTVAVGEAQEDGLIDVVYVARRPAEGVNAGQIENSQLAGEAIHAAIDEVQQALGCRITEVYAGISGEFVRCACYTDHVYVGNPHDGVSQADVDSLFSRMRNVQAPEGETIMERIPQSYVIDGKQEVKNPVGSFGVTLSATFNFVLCSTTPLQRLEMVLKRHGITIRGIFPSVLAIPESVLSPDEKSEGVAVVDIGGGTTDVTVYYRNVVRYVASIPMGASAINQDIRSMGVPEKYVEQLKIEKGSAIAARVENVLVKVPGRTPREEKGVHKRNLAAAIEARAMDIAEYVLQEIKDSRYASKLAYGIVLTGGSAVLRDLDKLFNRETKMDVRIATPDTGITEASCERLNHPTFATVAGLLLLGARKGASSVIVERPPVREEAPAEQPVAAPEPVAAPQPAVAPAENPFQPSAAPTVSRPVPRPTAPQPEPLPDPESFRHVPPKPQPVPATPVIPVAPPAPVVEPEPAPVPTPEPAEEPRIPVQPGSQRAHAVEEDPEAAERTEAIAAKMKDRIKGFFGGLNKKWDKGSSSELDDDTEI